MWINGQFFVFQYSPYQFPYYNQRVGNDFRTQKVISEPDSVIHWNQSISPKTANQKTIGQSIFCAFSFINNGSRASIDLVKSYIW